jgi:NAD(P)-dependent dehydrogenase (short-subunit alcohol dehydrogenase family)
MTSQPILLILGSGPRIGHSIAAQFASNNYTIVTASRSGIGSKTAEGYLSLKADFTKPESIPGIFDAIKAEYNTAPSVVIYNAAALTPPADKESVLSVSAEKVESDLRVNVVSPYVAAMQAVAGWERLGKNFK